MPKRRARRPDKRATGTHPATQSQALERAASIAGRDAVVVHDSQGRTERPALPDDEGIDYSDIPDVGDDDAYWTGGQVGPVVPAK